jgi:hypothetical protein
MDCLASVFVDVFSNFSTFSVVLLVLGRPERSSSSTDTRPDLKRECHSKTSVRLKECSPKASQSISSVTVADLLSFTQNLMWTHCSILPDKTKHEDKKHSCKNSACSQRGVTGQTDAIDLRKCDPSLPSYLFSPRQLQQ